MKKIKKSYVLCLKTVNNKMQSYGGFQWPASGIVKCPDWKPTKQCGNGLHAALKGEGDGSLFSWDANAKWLVLNVKESDIIDLGGKVKFPECEVLYSGDRLTATQIIYDNYHTAVIGGTAAAGYKGTAAAGYKGTAAAGDGGTAVAGDRGTAVAGDGGTAAAGDRGTAAAGDEGIIQIRFWDGLRYRIKTGYIGEDGLIADTAYKIINGDFVAVK